MPMVWLCQLQMGVTGPLKIFRIIGAGICQTELLHIYQCYSAFILHHCFTYHHIYIYIYIYIYINNGLLYCVSWKCRYIHWCLQRGFEFHYARYQKMIAEAMNALTWESWWTYWFRHLRMLVSRINRIFSVIGYRKSYVEIDTMLKARYISLCLSFILS